MFPPQIRIVENSILVVCFRAKTEIREDVFKKSGIILRKKFARSCFQVLILRNLIPEKAYVFPSKIEILCVQKQRRDYLNIPCGKTVMNNDNPIEPFKF